MSTILSTPPVAFARDRATRAVRHRAAVIVVVCGLLLTVVGAWRATHVAGTYRSEVWVYFLAPISARNPNTLVVSSASLITTAGLVQEQVVTSGVDPTAGAVTLTGEGVRDGSSVSLPNSGGQWANNFDTPALNVQVVGPTSTGVSSRTGLLLAEIASTLARLQDVARVAPVNRIVLNRIPSVPYLFYERGSRIRALGASLLLGTALSLVAGAVTARRRTRRPGPSSTTTRRAPR